MADDLTKTTKPAPSWRYYVIAFVLVALNFTPVPRKNYRIGVPVGGTYYEIFNSDSSYYGGSNLGNMGHIDTSSEPQMEWPYSVVITLPPLAGIILSLESARGLAVLTDEARE